MILSDQIVRIWLTPEGATLLGDLVPPSPLEAVVRDEDHHGVWIERLALQSGWPLLALKHNYVAAIEAQAAGSAAPAPPPPRIIGFQSPKE